MRDLTTLFKALSEDTRLKIISLLFRHRELTVVEVEEKLGITQSKASRHLRYLLNSDMVEYRREGVLVHYKLRKPKDRIEQKVAKVIKCLIQST